MDTLDSLNDRETPEQASPKTKALALPKVNRVARIREAVLEETTQQQINLPASARKLRESYADSRQHSKSRERQTPVVDSSYFASKPAQNKYKRAKPPQTNFQEKYQKLEENFKKFSATMQERRKSKSPVASDAKQVDFHSTRSTNLNRYATHFHPSSVQSPRAPNEKRDRHLDSMCEQVSHLASCLTTQLCQLSVSHDQEAAVNQSLA